MCNRSIPFTSARTIEQIMNDLLDMFALDAAVGTDFIRGALCALEKVIEFKRRQDLEWNFFKSEITDAATEEIDAKQRTRIEKGEQVSFLS